MKRYYKIINGKYTFYDGRIILNDTQIFNPTEEQILSAGYTEYIQPTIDVEEVDEKENIKKEIQDLKDELSSEDYKIIKCMEAKLIKHPLPYNIHELVSKRTEKRKRINQLESELCQEEE